MNWAWLFEAGLIEGDLAKYESGELSAQDINHAIKTAYLAANDAQRKKLVDMAWASGKSMGGNKEYWYTARPNQVQDFAAGFSGVRVEPTPALGDANLKDYNDGDEASRFLALGGKPQIWKDSDTGTTYVVYFMRESEPPIPLLYEVPEDGKTLQAFFGEGVTIVWDKTFSGAEMDATGAVQFGSTDNLDDSEGDPWQGFKQRVERAKEVSPWYNDDEILALLGGAYLENRPMEAWELETTDWYQEHNDKEREWLKLSISDPASAQVRIEDYNRTTVGLFDAIGADGMDPALTNWMANKYITGAWSLQHLTDQVEAVVSGWTELDGDLQKFLDESDFEIATSQQGFDDVKSLYNKWLGPAFAPSDADVQEWATKLRNSADGRDELIGMLQQQRLTMYPGYEDPNVSYQDIAGPWKNLGFSVWGQKMDETSDMFQKMMHMNDYEEANAMLRKEGLANDVEKVWKESTESFRSDTSTNTRRAV